LTSIALAPEKQKTQTLNQQTQKSSEGSKNLAKQNQKNSAKPASAQKSAKLQPTLLADVSERLFDISSSEFNAKWKSPMLPPFMMGEVYEAGDGMIAEQTTDSAGAATFDVSGSGNFLLIAKYVWTDANGAAQTSYISSRIFANAFKGDSNTATVKLFAKKSRSPATNNPAIAKMKTRWEK
jgi:hypothetical protein